ncbi:MaoC family dehydratase [uncultured Ruegeria sp.]|uniref:MaoC family dehydratase n=1 Tax=uncultured Ruegeria sp. TaxID=259304 RepID=UPI00261738A0|nr:MaoC family dehydratase [uncultured Ruegeria sp.]
MTESLKAGTYGFHDLRVGDVIKTGSAEISANLISDFAALTGDRYELHLDDSAAKVRGFKARVAHGLLVLSVVDGLKFEAEAKPEGLASLGWDWRFEKPVFAGDTIRAELTVVSKRTTTSSERGIISFRFDVFNQDEMRVQQGTNELIFDL